MTLSWTFVSWSSLTIIFLWQSRGSNVLVLPTSDGKVSLLRSVNFYLTWTTRGFCRWVGLVCSLAGMELSRVSCTDYSLCICTCRWSSMTLATSVSTSYSCNDLSWTTESSDSTLMTPCENAWLSMLTRSILFRSEAQQYYFLSMTSYVKMWSSISVVFFAIKCYNTIMYTFTYRFGEIVLKRRYLSPAAIRNGLRLKFIVMWPSKTCERSCLPRGRKIVGSLCSFICCNEWLPSRNSNVNCVSKFSCTLLELCWSILSC